VTTAKEQCAGILAGLAELIQLCEEPKAKETLIQAQALIQDAIANASDAEAEAIIRIFQTWLNNAGV
jgi:hypothetical protein